MCWSANGEYVFLVLPLDVAGRVVLGHGNEPLDGDAHLAGARPDQLGEVAGVLREAVLRVIVGLALVVPLVAALRARVPQVGQVLPQRLALVLRVLAVLERVLLRQPPRVLQTLLAEFQVQFQGRRPVNLPVVVVPLELFHHLVDLRRVVWEL
jgi:hypothetical protein